MAFIGLGSRVRRLFGKDDGASTSSREPLDESQSAFAEFMAIREARLSRLSDAEIDQIAADALATVDRETTLREVEGLHERWKVQPGLNARSRSE